jgi:hypothetical protein
MRHLFARKRRNSTVKNTPEGIGKIHEISEGVRHSFRVLHGVKNRDSFRVPESSQLIHASG